MKKLLSLIFAISLILSACGTAQTQIAPPAQTSTPTLTPTETQIPITPLPAIPTFTPTFDISTIVTVTPAEKAECPTINLNIKPEDYLPSKIEMGFFNVADKILQYLNKGGDGQFLLERLRNIYPEVEYTGGYDYRDVTGDQVPEFLYIELQFEGKPIVFSCKGGKYEQIATLAGNRDYHTYNIEVVDLNLDGTTEIIVTGTICGGTCGSTIYIYEWKEQSFLILAEIYITALRQTQIKDLDGNGITEISLLGDNPNCISCSNFIPQRQRTIIYTWNGNIFVEISNEFTAPEYRFQAVQDADKASNFGKNEIAMQYYDDVINNESLEWWSAKRLVYEQTIANPVEMFIATPPSEPTKEPSEYPRLAAYAYYRIMLLHLAQGQEVEAASTYQTLQETFGADPYAVRYIEMATAFWESYQSTHRMYDGCAAAIQYAVEHPEILIPLGSDYHGWQSHMYEPADVCPFR